MGERYRANIEALKQRGYDQKAEIIRDIFRGYPDEVEGPVPLSDVQSIAWDKMNEGAYPKTTLANTRRMMYDSPSGSYGFFTHSKRGVKNLLEMTELGQEFNSWLFSEGGLNWGKSTSRPKREGNVHKRQEGYKTGGPVREVTEPLVIDDLGPNRHGLIVAHVPAGVDIVWVEEIENEDGTIKKKPHKIPRVSEETVSEVDMLKNRLRALGEDV